MRDKKSGFDDIILEKNSKNERIKKILLRAIILIIVFLVVIIIMKLINSPTEENKELVPPPPQEQSSTFENTPIVQDKQEDDFNALAKRLKDESMQEEKVFEAVPNILPKEPLKDEAKIEPKIEQKEEPKVEQNPFKKPDIKQEEKKAAPPKAKKSENPADLFKNLGIKNEGELKPGKYIQVYSLLKVDPSSAQLQKLRDKNYDYIVYKISRNDKDLHKILIGPVPADKLSEKLKKIREEISAGAYSFTIK